VDARSLRHREKRSSIPLLPVRDSVVDMSADRPLQHPVALVFVAVMACARPAHRIPSRSFVSFSGSLFSCARSPWRAIAGPDSKHRALAAATRRKSAAGNFFLDSCA